MNLTKRAILDNNRYHTAHAAPDAIAAAIGRLNRNWGIYGYTVTAIDSPTFQGARLWVTASDGSRFTVSVDRYGNPDEANESEVRA